MAKKSKEIYDIGIHYYQELLLSLPYGTALPPILGWRLTQVESCVDKLMKEYSEDLMALYYASVLLELLRGYSPTDLVKLKKKSIKVSLMADAIRRRSITRSLTGLYAIFDHDINSKSDLDMQDLFGFFDMTEVTILTFSYYEHYATDIYQDYERLCDDICLKAMRVFMEQVNPEVDKLLIGDSSEKQKLINKYKEVVRLSIYMSRLVLSEKVHNGFQDYLASVQEFLKEGLGYTTPIVLQNADLSLDWFKEQELFLSCKASKDFTSYFEVYPSGYFYYLAFSQFYFLHKIEEVLFWVDAVKKGEIMDYYERFPEGVMSETAIFYLSSLN